MRPVYTLDQLVAAAVLKAEIGPFDVFVEDTGLTNLYRRLVQQALELQRPPINPIALGSRDNLLRFIASHAPRRRKACLAIVDGDFHFVRGEEEVLPPNTHRLQCYAVENLVLEREALIEIGIDASANLTQEQIEELLNLDSFEEVSRKYLEPLYILYAVANLLVPNVPTTGVSVASLTANGRLRIIDRAAFRRRYVSLVRNIIAMVGATRYREAMRIVRRSVADRRLTWRQIVSGKHALLPLAQARVSQQCAYRGSREQLAVSLAAHCTFRLDTELKHQIRRVGGLLT